MTKLNKRIFAVCIIIACILEYSLFLSDKDTAESFQPTISKKSIDNFSDTEIVVVLFTMYLENYKTKPIFDHKKLKDYKDIKVVEVDTLEGVFSVTYSIQPLWSSYWYAGNGVDGDNGWILRKAYYVKIIKEDEQYRLWIAGTEL